jgi:nucleotide-binding universal stress UspA family protein
MKQSNGPVVVLLDESDTLEQAAAAATVRSAELRIVHAFHWPYLFDPLGELTVDERDLEAAETAAHEAIDYVQQIYPGLRISSTLFPGRPVTALLHEARESTDALVVIGHGRRFERRLARQLARRTTASLAAAA